MILTEVMKIKGKFNILTSHLQKAEDSEIPDTEFVKKFEKFVEDNGENIVFLEEECLKTKEFYYETMLYLGEK